MATDPLQDVRHFVNQHVRQQERNSLGLSRSRDPVPEDNNVGSFIGQSIGKRVRTLGFGSVLGQAYPDAIGWAGAPGSPVDYDAGCSEPQLSGYKVNRFNWLE